MAAKTVKTCASHGFVLTAQSLTCFFFSSVTMSELETVDIPEKSKKRSDNDETVQDLKAAIARLQAENASLRTTTSTSNPTQPNVDQTKLAANQFLSNLSQGISQGISQAMSNMKPTVKQKSKPITIEVDPELPECYCELKHQEKTDNFGPPISDNISELLERCWHYPFRKDEIVDILDKQVRPQNLLAVKPLQVNPEVKARMTKQDKSNEKDMRYIGNAVCAAGKCLSYVMDMLAQAEVQLRQDYPEDEGWLMIDEFSFDFPKANKLITNAMKILGMANVQTGQARRAMLAPKFRHEFRQLCNRENPFEDGLFFGSLDSATQLISDANKVQNKTFEQKPNNNFRGRGRGKRWSYRSSPYQSQSSQLQAALVQQALAGQQPQLSQQVSGVTTGGVFGINQFPQQPPPLLNFIPSTALRPRGRGKGRGGFRGRRGRNRGRHMWVFPCLTYLWVQDWNCFTTNGLK